MWAAPGGKLQEQKHIPVSLATSPTPTNPSQALIDAASVESDVQTQIPKQKF